MNYGLWMSAAGLGSQVHRQNILSNNLANASTTAFKPDFTQTIERPTAVEELGKMATSAHMLEKLGGGVLSEPTWTNFAQGGFEESGNPLDLALEGPGFFMVKDAAGENQLTRAGVFERSREGLLVDPNGNAVLDTRGKSIRLPEADAGLITIGPDGTISTGDGDVAGQISIVSAEGSDLRKSGKNLYQFVGKGAPAAADVDTTVRQGWTEASGTDPILEMTRMVDTSRAVQANARLIGIHDEVMNLAVNRLGSTA